MATTKYITVHLVPVVRRDPKSKAVRRKNIQPGTVVSDFSEEEATRLKALGAIKEYKAEENAPKEESSKDGEGTGGEDGKQTRTREELEARAKELELSYPSNIGDDKLAEKVAAAEAENDGL